jgi:uncharacterized protein YndB with AHSA1/START domain
MPRHPESRWHHVVFYIFKEATDVVENRIERDIAIAAPVELVWRVVTEPEHVGVWFGNGEPAKIDLRPGGRIVYEHVGHGELPAVVETVDAPRVFSYRWAVIGPPGEEPRDGNSTLVEFTLTPDGDATRLQIVETGFAGVEAPQEEVGARFEANSRGWGRILDTVRQHTEQLVKAG